MDLLRSLRDLIGISDGFLASQPVYRIAAGKPTGQGTGVKDMSAWKPADYTPWPMLSWRADSGSRGGAQMTNRCFGAAWLRSRVLCHGVAAVTLVTHMKLVDAERDSAGCASDVLLGADASGTELSDGFDR